VLLEAISSYWLRRSLNGWRKMPGRLVIKLCGIHVSITCFDYESVIIVFFTKSIINYKAFKSSPSSTGVMLIQNESYLTKAHEIGE